MSEGNITGHGGGVEAENDEKSAAYFEEMLKRLKTGLPFVVSRKELLVGGQELLPPEVKMDFSDVRNIIKSLEEKGKFHSVLLFLTLIEKLRAGEKPTVVEVGKDGGVTNDCSPFTSLDRELMEKVNYISAGVVDPRIVSFRECFAHVPLEKLSVLLGNGHRANIFYLGNVLTTDGVAADVETKEKRENILSELYNSTMPGSIVVAENYNTTGFNFTDEELKNAGFEPIRPSARTGNNVLILIRE